ncbi:thioredoxin family protein [Pedobacter gandavensis]|uniref:DUF255 domain-containing protein n=1 Tax=Pedobacter gandavensis TaxID=2679963 RepID=A0ABR6F3U0_9SPHI|nr:thioredoxin family protein [Pedobacter gandavensis]MBB2151378.1 DUF255 domain-containing protein [Pedobacter gandavensis]
MKKNLIGIFLLFSSLSVFAQGIEFEHSSWSEVLKKAKELNKPIFIDVYTSWCGPCKVMAAEVFTRPEIGAKYNKGFVNFKIDAEKGEGIAIAQKYEVKSYPTYLFINPADESLFDRSKSSMPAASFNDLADKILTKFSGKKEISLAELEAKYKSDNYDEGFAQAYIKRLNAEGKSTREVLGKYLTKFVSNKPSTAQLYFLGLNFSNGTDLNLYRYMIDHYKMIDAVLCKNDGIAAGSLYRNLRTETGAKIESILSSNVLIAENGLQLKQLFQDLNTVEIEERKDKKVLEYKIRIYTGNGDTAQLLKAYRSYIQQFLLPADQTAAIGRESIILNKNAPVPVLPIDSATAADWCCNYAIRLTKLSKDPEDKQLAGRLFEKAMGLSNSAVIQNKRNVTTYNLGDQAKAIKQQAVLLAELRNSHAEYLDDVAATLQKMENNEPNISVFQYKRKLLKKH